jgi:O-antigen/teichoic acid export membrane protein
LDEIGLFTLVTANAMMVSPLCSVGMNGSYIKFFPSIKNSPQLARQFFTFQFVIVIIANLIILSVAFVGKDFIISQFSKGSSEYVRYLTITGIIVIVNSIFDLLYAYCSAILKVIFPSFLREVFLRMGAIFLVLGYAGGYFGFDWAVKGLAINYSLVLLLLMFQLVVYQKLRFSFNFLLIDKEWRKKILNFAIYSMSLAVSFAVLNNTSYNQISSIMGDAYNGIFVTCFFIGVIVEMPRRNMARVINPMISNAMNEGDIKHTEVLYKKSSITMAVIGALLFIGIMTNLDTLFTFIPKGADFSKGFGVVLAVCAAKLISMISSFSGEIINFSKHYRFNLLFQVIAALFLIVLNYYLIPIYGLNGVALSYFLTILLHSLVKYQYVQSKFDIHPFMRSHIKLVVISAITFVIFYFFNSGLNAIIDILIRSVLTTIFFTFLIYKMKVSVDINQLIDALLLRLKGSK